MHTRCLLTFLLLMLPALGGGPARAQEPAACSPDPEGTWTLLSTEGAPSPRLGASSVWTGHEWLVWGGTGPGATPFDDGVRLADGARYDPMSDAWTPMSTAGA